jgi:hypothetical protein
MKASTRRATLGAILAAPLASVPVVAEISYVSDHEARFLALAPRIVSLCDEHDRIWPGCKELYAAWEVARVKMWGQTWHVQTERLPEWHAYIEARKPADEIDRIMEDRYEPFHDVRFVSFDAIKLRHRWGMTFDWICDDVSDDLDALWGARPCA